MELTHHHQSTLNLPSTDSSQWQPLRDIINDPAFFSTDGISLSENIVTRLQSKVINAFDCFVQQHENILKDATYQFKAEYDHLSSEAALLHEENEQLNEMSLNLLSQIGKLKKFLHDSDALISWLRAEVSHLKRDKKILVHALEGSLDGRRDSGLRLLHELQEIDNSTFPQGNAKAQLQSCRVPRRKRSLPKRQSTIDFRVETRDYSLDRNFVQSAQVQHRVYAFDIPHITTAKPLNNQGSQPSSKNELSNPQNSARSDIEYETNADNGADPVKDFELGYQQSAIFDDKSTATALFELGKSVYTQGDPNYSYLNNVLPEYKEIISAEMEILPLSESRHLMVMDLFEAKREELRKNDNQTITVQNIIENDSNKRGVASIGIQTDFDDATSEKGLKPFTKKTWLDVVKRLVSKKLIVFLILIGMMQYSNKESLKLITHFLKRVSSR